MCEKKRGFYVKTFRNSLKTAFFTQFQSLATIYHFFVKTAMLTSDIIENGFCWQPIHM